MLWSNILQKLNNVRTCITMNISMFWDITPCSSLKVNRSFGGTCRLHLQGWRIAKQETSVKQTAIRVQLEMKEMCSSETSVDIQRITQPHISEDTPHNCHRENLKSCMYYNASFQNLNEVELVQLPTRNFLFWLYSIKNYMFGVASMA
jgi:hypothetical protein